MNTKLQIFLSPMFRILEFYLIHVLLPWMEVLPTGITIGQQVNTHSPTKKESTPFYRIIPFTVLVPISSETMFPLNISWTYKKVYLAYFLFALFFLHQPHIELSTWKGNKKFSFCYLLSNDSQIFSIPSITC